MKYTLEDFQAKWPNTFSNVRCGFDLPIGWGPIVWKLFEILESCGDVSNVQVVQVKEKFGLLRIYYDCDYDHEMIKQVRELFEFTESMSGYVCEECSTTKDVETHSGSGYWITTLCNTCRDIRELSKKK